MALQDDLRFGTARHQFVLQEILKRKRFSQEAIRKREIEWTENEEAYLAYMPEKEVDRKRRKLRESGEPMFTTLKIPFDYAVLMSMHTYMTSVFLGRSPILQYSGRNGQGQSGSLAVESLMDYQVTVGRMLPPQYIWLLDVGKYGLGVMGSFWDEEQVLINQEVDVEDSFLGVSLGTTKKEMQRTMIKGYQGNKLFNIRPWDWLPDPRVTFTRLQEGEFCGFYSSVGWNLVAKKAAFGKFFNVDVLQSRRAQSISERQRGSTQVIHPFGHTDNTAFTHPELAPIEALHMWVDLIPRDWGLGDSTFPEKWVFVVANDEIILTAQPMGDFHDKFPFHVLENESDGYTLFKRSILEIAKPMTDVITWLINTHFYNTRKALNDMFVVDPTKVVLKDLQDPQPGKIIRLKEEMYGQDVRSAISQFQVQDVTRGHLEDTQVMSSLLQRVTGVNDSIMGLVNQGGRKTATEVRTSSTFGINRLKTVAEWFSATGYTDMSTLLLQMTQQHYDMEQVLRVAGDAANTPGAAKALRIGPADIQGFYDFVPVDGTLPVDRFAQVNMWSTLLQQMSSSPQVMQQYDMAGIFGWVAQLGGLKNVNQFKVELAPTDQLQNEADAGNVIPLRNQNGPGGGTAPRADGDTPRPSQIPGVGTTG